MEIVVLKWEKTWETISSESASSEKIDLTKK